MKTKANRKWKIPHTPLEKRTLCFSSYKNRKLKVKLWWDRAHERKKRVFFEPFILSEGNFFKTDSIYNVLNTKHYFIQISCLFLKLPKAFSVSLSNFFCEFEEIQRKLHSIIVTLLQRVWALSVGA